MINQACCQQGHQDQLLLVKSRYNCDKMLDVFVRKFQLLILIPLDVATVCWLRIALMSA
jgi:hypothetical protein